MRLGLRGKELLMVKKTEGQMDPPHYKALAATRELGAALRRHFVTFGITCMNSVLGGLPSKGDRHFTLCMRLRDSAMYRVSCIEYHLCLLFVTDSRFSKKVRAARFGENDPGHVNLMLSAQEQELFLLDDLVFHLISLLDYLGNLVGFAFYGEQRTQLKWKGALRYSSNREAEGAETGLVLLSGSETGKLVQHHDDQLVQHLKDYRARIFHYEKDAASVRLTTSLKSDEENRLVVKAPRDLAKWLLRVHNGAAPRNKALPELALWLTEETFKAVKEIIEVLTADVSRNAPSIRKGLKRRQKGQRPATNATAQHMARGPSRTPRDRT